MHQKNIIYAGKAIKPEGKALIMVHGRGASPDDILSIARYFPLDDFSLLAPAATGNSWYPYSFLAPTSQNEPWLSSALELLKHTVEDLVLQGIPRRSIYLLGFSQGACLSLEFAARNAMRYGGIIAFTGGLIGDTVNLNNYSGDFDQTPVFIGSSDPDPHVPVQRVQDTSRILKAMNANLTTEIYPGMGHTIHQDEIEKVNQLIFHQ